MAERNRAALVDVVLQLASKGIFRASAQQLADLAGVRRQAICRYFGSVDLLYRVVARERWQQVAPCLPFELGICDFGGQYAQAAVWAVLVGKPRVLS